MATPTDAKILANNIIKAVRGKKTNISMLVTNLAQAFSQNAINGKLQSTPNPERMIDLRRELIASGFSKKDLEAVNSAFKENKERFLDLNIRKEGITQFSQQAHGWLANNSSNRQFAHLINRKDNIMNTLIEKSKLPIEQRIEYMNKTQDAIFGIFEKYRDAGLNKDLKEMTDLFKERFIEPGVKHEASQPAKQQVTQKKPSQRKDSFPKLKRTTNTDRKNAANQMKEFREKQLKSKETDKNLTGTVGRPTFKGGR